MMTFYVLLLLVQLELMQHLLNLCYLCTTNHQLSYNATKSFSLRINPNRIKIKPPNRIES